MSTLSHHGVPVRFVGESGSTTGEVRTGEVRTDRFDSSGGGGKIPVSDLEPLDWLDRDDLVFERISARPGFDIATYDIVLQLRSSEPTISVGSESQDDGRSTGIRATSAERTVESLFLATRRWKIALKHGPIDDRTGRDDFRIHRMCGSMIAR